MLSKKDWKNQWRMFSDYCKMGETKTVVCMALTCTLEAVRPYVTLVLMGYLLDLVYAGTDYRTMLKYTGIAFFYTFASSCIESFCHKRYNRKLEYMFEQQSYLMNQKCLSMDYEYLEDKKVHDKIFQIAQSYGGRFGLMGDMLSEWEYLLRSGISMVAAVVIVFPLFTEVTSIRDGIVTSWLASLLLCALVALATFYNYHFDVKIGAVVRGCQEEKARHSNGLGYYMNILASYDKQKDLRIYHQEQMVSERTDAAMDALDAWTNKEARSRMKSAFVKQTVSAASGLAVYLFAGIRAFLGFISVGSVVTYAASIIRMTTSMATLMQHLAHLKTLNPYIRDYVEFMDLGGRKYEGTIPVEKRKDDRFTIEFSHVSFRYPGAERDVIHDLNLNFTIGNKVAIVGKNGSGKTTFIKLLCRLYDVTKGCIKVNGIDIRKYNYREYCDLFSVVFQDFQMFAFPLGENIAACSEVDKDQALSALGRAGLTQRMLELPDGLDTCVGKEFDERGVTFSGGEKQKMAIARAIYKDAPFVIMDEPTAALDPVSECEVFAGFDKMVGNKTAVYISHRLASCRFCEDILVFDKGTVVQRGSHDDLLAQGGLYRKLWDAQAKYYA